MLTITGDIITPAGCVSRGALTVDDQGTIAQIEAKRTSLAQSEDIDATGYLVVPGFIDMHIHGGGGADFMQGTVDAARQILRTHARFGTTGMLATTLTASREATDAAILSALSLKNGERATDEARVLGIHLEGPYICMAKRGAQPEAFVRPPDLEELTHWIELSENTVREITMAPEVDGAEPVIRAAAQAGVVVSAGHTNSYAKDVIKAIEWGVRQSTHTFNAMRGLMHREPGTVGAVLISPEIMAEVISDGKHLDPMVVKLIIESKGIDGVVLITDAMEGAAMPDAEYTLGGFTVIVKDGTAAFPDGTLAGSVLTMNRAFANVIEFAKVSPVQAAVMASANAAKQIGVFDTLGSLEVGKQADFAVIDPKTGEVAWTVIGGKVAYKR